MPELFVRCDVCAAHDLAARFHCVVSTSTASGDAEANPWLLSWSSPDDKRRATDTIAECADGGGRADFCALADNQK